MQKQFESRYETATGTGINRAMPSAIVILGMVLTPLWMGVLMWLAFYLVRQWF
jgi:hypothetical protein